MCIRDRSYYDGYYNADNLPAKATRTWTTKTVAEKDSDGTDVYKRQYIISVSTISSAQTLILFISLTHLI